MKNTGLTAFAFVDNDELRRFAVEVESRLSQIVSYRPEGCQVRLSLSPTDPVPGDLTAQGRVYCHPYRGRKVALYTGTGWVVRDMPVTGMAVPNVANATFDVFLYDRAGTPALTTMQWYDDTTRAADLTTLAGVQVLSDNTAWRFIGMIRTGSAGECTDSVLKRHCVTYHHRLFRPLLYTDATASWGYTTGSWRQANNDSGYEVSFLSFGDEAYHVSANPQVGGSGGVVSGFLVGLGEDTTSGTTEGARAAVYCADGERESTHVTLCRTPDAGYHTVALNEYGAANAVVYANSVYGTITGWIRG